MSHPVKSMATTAAAMGQMYQLEVFKVCRWTLQRLYPIPGYLVEAASALMRAAKEFITLRT